MPEETPLHATEAIVWTDGAARGNPGPAGAGAVIKTRDGNILAEVVEYLGTTTNNVAEYKALLLGLERALALGIRRLEVRADSELLIKQLRGEYRVRHYGLKPLYETAKRLLGKFERFELNHVRRELNGEADRLANRGIDEAASVAEAGAQLTSTANSTEEPGSDAVSASKSSER